MKRILWVFALLLSLLGGTMIALAQYQCNYEAACSPYPSCYKRNGAKWQSTTQRCSSECASGGYCTTFSPGICKVYNCSTSGYPCQHQGQDSYTDFCNGEVAVCPCDLY